MLRMGENIVNQASETNITDEIIIIRAVVRFRRMANFLLGQSNGEYREEQLIRPDVLLAMNNLLLKGHGAIRFVDRDSLPLSYIVVRGRTRYTTTTPPNDLDPGDIVTLPQFGDEKTSSLRDGCFQLAAHICETSMEAYQGFGIETAVSVLKMAIEKPELIDIPTHEVIARVLSHHSSVPISRQHFTEAFNEVFKAFRMCHLVGDSASEVIAALTFLMLHPLTSSVYKIALETDPLKALTKKRELDVIQIPPLEIGYYLTHPQIRGMGSFLVAKHVGSLLRKIAREEIQKANGTESIVQFHESLVAAFILYRAAKVVYKTFEHIADKMPQMWELANLDPDQANRHSVETEEMRVAILTSLFYVAWPGPAGPDLMEPLNFFGYWENQLNAIGADQLVSLIYDMPVRLVFPELYRDLTLAWLAAKTRRQVDDHIDRTLRTAQRLEQNIKQLALSGDPNYLAITYAILAKLTKHQGQAEAAREYTHRAGRANLNPKLANMLPD